MHTLMTWLAQRRRAFLRGVCNRRGHQWPVASGIMHPQDWAAMRMHRTAQGAYLLAPPWRCARCACPPVCCGLRASDSIHQHDAV